MKDIFIVWETKGKQVRSAEVVKPEEVMQKINYAKTVTKRSFSVVPATSANIRKFLR